MATLPAIPTAQLTSTGLTLPTAQDWQTFWAGNGVTPGVFQVLYGSDIVLTSDTPDGQLIGIITQILLDNQDLVQQVYSSFDIMQAFGVTLDQRLLLGGITRLGGTYSKVNMTIVSSLPIQLYGLDQTAQPVFTVSDSNNNQYELVTSYVTSGGTDTNVIFQATLPGPITSAPGDITNQTSSIVGIGSVTNPSAPYTIGLAEETDAAAKIRFLSIQKGYYTQLYAALMGLSGMASVNIQENDTNSNNSSMPNTGTGSISNAHSIWVIVGGDAGNADIANAIYNNRPMGTGMLGSTSYVITRPNGSTFTVYWDIVQGVQIYVLFHVQSMDGKTVPQVANIEQQLSASATTGSTLSSSWASGATQLTLTANSGNGLLIAPGQVMVANDLAVGTTVIGIVESGPNWIVTFSPPAPSSGSSETVTFVSQGLFQPGIGQAVNTNELATLVQEIDPNSFVSFSTPITGGITTVATNTTIQQVTFFQSISGLPPALGSFKFVYGLLGSTPAINWYDSANTVQTRLRSIDPSLNFVTVTGSIAAGLNIVFTGVSAPATPLTISNNTLADAGSAAIVPAINPITVEIPNTFISILNTLTAAQQANLIPSRTIVYPMIIEPAPSAPNSTWAASVSGANVITAMTVLNSVGSTQQLTVVGGYAPFYYTLTTNNSVGSCSLTGFYTPGSTAGVADTVTVTDAMGQTATITINVVV